MCTSRYFRVVEVTPDDAVIVEDAAGRRSRMALVAYEGPPSEQGAWVVAHAGYALAPAGDGEVADAIDELRRLAQRVDEERSAPRSREAS